jgi:hypothetical protein
MLSFLNAKDMVSLKKEYVRDLGKSLNVFEVNEASDGYIRLQPKENIKENDRAIEFLDIAQNLNKQKVNYIISTDGIFHICNLQR